MSNVTGWDLEELSGGSGGKKNNFTRFPEGITRIRVLSKLPHFRWTHWMPQFSRKVTCSGFNCPLCKIQKAEKAQGVKQPKYGSVRNYSVVVINHDKNQVEILEEGVTMFEELKDAINDAVEANPGTSINSFIFRVRKKIGSSDKATWRVDVEEVSEPSEVELEAMKDLIVLKDYYAPGTDEQLAELLQVPPGAQKDIIKDYNRIMGYVKEDEAEDASVAFEVAEG